MEKLKRVVIKQELVELTGDFRPALILNQFIYWTERMFDTDKYIQEERERASKYEADVNIDESNGWIYKKASDLNDELMVGMSNPTIGKYINQLVKAGYLTQRRNPKYKWDKTLQYRVDMYKVQKDLGKLGYALEGYKLLPNIEIVEEEEVIEEAEIVEENKKDLSAPTDKPIQNTDSNNIDTPIICESTDNIQEEENSSIDLEELREIAKEILISRNDKFATYLPSTQLMLIEKEFKILKEKRGLGNYGEYKR